MIKLMKLSLSQCVNQKAWFAVDEEDKRMYNGEVAYASYPLLDPHKPYGEMALILPEELDDTIAYVMIENGYAYLTSRLDLSKYN